MAAHPPTPEQVKVIDAVRKGDDTVVQAGAGTGKTTTLVNAASALRGKRVLYLAYNRAMADEAKGKFGRTADCMTTHGLANRAMRRDPNWTYALNARLNASSRESAYAKAKRLRVNQAYRLGDAGVLQPTQVVSLAGDAVARFRNSSSPVLGANHVTKLPGLEDYHADLVSIVLPVARRMWEQIATPAGEWRFTHDDYLKLWALTQPDLSHIYDVVFLDEAQDTNGCVGEVFTSQGIQKVAVGDGCQQLYAWRGAEDALEKLAGTVCYLSTSFRFGQAVADEANKWLAQPSMRTPMRLVGRGGPSVIVDGMDAPDAVLCKKNATAIETVMAALANNTPVAMAGKLAGEIVAFAEAAAQLKAGKPTWHRDLMAFATWGQVQDYVDYDPEGNDLKTTVAIIEKYTPEGIISAMGRCVDESRARLVVSTAHGSKGREWDRVRIADDFDEPRDQLGQPAPVPRDLGCLAYVAVTRARKALDPGSLAWINSRVAQNSTPGLRTVA